jgi:SAM-dependent methyltransferase
VAFRRIVNLLEQAGVSLKTAHLLNLACGRLAPLPLLLTASGFQTTGADLNIPPAYLPTSGIKQWFKRGQLVKTWQAATAPYYDSLAQQTGLKLKWDKVKIDLADLTRLPYPGGAFEVVICPNHLPHAADVESLLAEAARVLKPGGWLVADIRPYPALTGAFGPDGTRPWAHLRGGDGSADEPGLIFNRWREAQYRSALEKFFAITQWQAEPDERAVKLLTPDIRTELSEYDEAELTCRQIIVMAQKLDSKQNTERNFL